MSVDGGITSSTSQVLVLPVGDVQMGLGVTEFLCETKIDNVNLVTAFADAHQEIVGFDIAVNEITRVDVLDARDLIEKKKNEKKDKQSDKIMNEPVGQQVEEQSLD